MHPIFVKADKQAVPILFVTGKTFTETAKALGARELVFVKAAAAPSAPVAAPYPVQRGLTAAMKQAGAAAGDYLLCWEAHGLGYGLPAVLAAELAAGRTVVANVSRTVLDEARSRFPGVRIVSVTAEPEAVAGRLARRSREDVEAVARRLARADIHAVAGEDVVVLPNNGDPREGVTALVAAIKG